MTGDDPRRDEEFGPGGYLPGRAARRARKIVLRAPLGLQWVIASVVAGVVLVVAGIVYLRVSTAPPGPPFVAAAEVAVLDDVQHLPALDVLVVVTARRVRAFEARDPMPELCAETGRLEAPDGRVWSLTGRALDRGSSLREHPTRVVGGVLYVDPTTSVPGPPPVDQAVTPACFP